VGAIPEWRWALVETVRGVPGLPARLAAGVRGRSTLGLAECALAGLLIVAFALSGHASAVPAPQFGYAVAVDLLHLLANAAWVGGLLYIGVVLVPALGGLEPRARARVLALGLPEFGVVAILSALLLAATGSLNTTIHLTSIQQFLTTAYGRTLFIKIELFLLMVAISAYHAFWLRPQLARALSDELAAGDVALREAEEALVTATMQAAPGGQGATKEPGAPRQTGRPLATRTAGLAQRLDDWLRREALLGVLVLLCVALLGAFAGSLATAPTGAAAAPSAGYIHTTMVGNQAITLKVDPAAFGTNTFTVRVTDPQGKAITGAAVSITTDMLDMDMGEQTTQLQPVGDSQPGVYSGQADLTMAGHWKVTVRVLPPDSKQFQTADFTFTAGY
jgi:copper transport protein